MIPRLQAAMRILDTLDISTVPPAKFNTVEDAIQAIIGDIDKVIAILQSK